MKNIILQKIKFTDQILISVFIIVIISSWWTQIRVNRYLPIDFHVYLTASWQAMHNQNFYQPFEVGSSFLYPPTALLLFVPLSLLKHLWEIWRYIEVISIILALFFVFKIISNSIHWVKILMFSVGAFIYAPFLEQIVIGQVNSLVLLGIVIYMFGVAYPKYKSIGDLGLATAIAIKITPLILFAFPLIRRDWKSCFRIFSYLTILMLISILAFGIPPWLDFLEVFPNIIKGYTGMNNQNINTLVKWLASLFTTAQVSEQAGQMFSTFILISWLIALIVYKDKSKDIALMNFGIITMTISSSLIWYHHYVFLIAPLASLILTTTQTQIGKVIFLLSMLGVILINTARMVEFWFMIPPISAIIGYLIIYLACGLSLTTRATHALE